MWNKNVDQCYKDVGSERFFQLSFVQHLLKNLQLLSHLRDDLRESTTGLVTDPDLLLGAERGADGLELSVDGLIRERLDAQLRLAGGVQLQMVSQSRVRKTLEVHKKPVRVCVCVKK